MPDEEKPRKSSPTRLPFGRIASVILILLFSCILIVVNAAIVAIEGFDAITLGWIGISALLPALLYGTIIVLLDVREREPLRLLALAFLWGAFVAMSGSYVINTSLYVIAAVAVGEGLGEVIAAVMVAPFVEESAKAAGLVLLVWLFRREFNNVTDGIVYGALIGIGFGMTENVVYLGSGYRESGTEEFAMLFYLRVILGGFGHAGYTALTGAGIGYLRETDVGRWRIAAPIIGLIAAMLGHAAWNSVFALLIGIALDPNDFFRYYVIVPVIVFLGMLPGYVAVLLLLIRSWHREAAIIRLYLESEVHTGELTPGEHQRLASTRMRLSYELRTLQSQGFRAWLDARRLHQKLTKLAFRKWQLSRGDLSAAPDPTLDVEFREPIRRLRSFLPPA